jgi:hypothetical protein
MGNILLPPADGVKIFLRKPEKKAAHFQTLPTATNTTLLILTSPTDSIKSTFPKI